MGRRCVQSGQRHRVPTAVDTGRLAYFENGSLSVTFIPEPGTTLLGAITALGLLRRRR